MRGLTDFERHLLLEACDHPPLWCDDDFGRANPQEAAGYEALTRQGLIALVPFEDGSEWWVATDRGRLALRLDAIVRMGVAA